MDEEIVNKCQILIKAFREGKLGQTKMPEDAHPDFENDELRLIYFTLPMALNYQRDSYKLWESALQTYLDEETKVVFDISITTDTEELRRLLLKYKLALQPNNHIRTWQTISKTIRENFGSLSNLLFLLNTLWSCHRDKAIS